MLNVITTFCLLAISESAFIGGRNCGSLTRITKIDQMPTDQASIDALNCVIVKNEESYQNYLRNLTCKFHPLINTAYKSVI